ncbi:hypothetical protein [Amycolatopsis sp. H20-H5]|uniref:hypothetical protein n=1 Tax=Amycolatopsis sp. H20-H5 TaxID=3046309 RepID=UPI002DBA3606|nr:hypothetical protein [Amycolatopsis sp. H20-H5]MEC3979892.1 hypothetical protein [Amycolatopsis sp. H20-H5]
MHRWELITGRPAPYPTQPGRHGRPVLAPVFVEWLMGLPPDWATAETLDLPRTAQLRALGNGVMPQQAAHALDQLLADLAELNRSPFPNRHTRISESCDQRDSGTRGPQRKRGTCAGIEGAT